MILVEMRVVRIYLLSVADAVMVQNTRKPASVHGKEKIEYFLESGVPRLSELMASCRSGFILDVNISEV